jgi:opacity protein-like surface antigen
MIKLRAAILGILGAIALTTVARAADMPSLPLPPAPDYDKSPRFRELLSGWYLRGDFGYRWNKIGSIDAPSTVTDHTYGNGLGLTLGWGFKYQWFRTDLTIDYGVPTTVRATTSAAVAQPQYSTKLSAITALANVYFDLGTWGGFTTYVGARAGASYLRSVTTRTLACRA